ncbi:MAG: cation transporter [Treponema sp.]|nr:cation transporter [Treponema sp.]
MERTDSFRTHYIRLAAQIALGGNLLLAGTKLLLAALSHSLAVLGDGIDSATDVLIALVTLVISAVIARPSDREHPWGHGRAETTATMLLAFIISVAGGELVLSSAKRLIFRDFSQELSLIAILAPVISIAGKSVLAVSQYKLGSIANSDIVKANALNMKNDIFLSAGVLAGLCASVFFHCPVLDPAIALVLGLWIIKNAVSLFIGLNRELMDGNTDKSLYSRLFHAAISVEGVSNPHRARIRKIASMFDIDLDIEVSPTLTMYEAHEKAERVEAAIRAAIPDVYDVVIHLEPAGSDTHQPVECFGLSPSQLEMWK